MTTVREGADGVRPGVVRGGQAAADAALYDAKRRGRDTTLSAAVPAR